MYCPVVGSLVCISCNPTCGGTGGNIDSIGIVAGAAKLREDYGQRINIDASGTNASQAIITCIHEERSLTLNDNCRVQRFQPIPDEK